LLNDFSEIPWLNADEKIWRTRNRKHIGFCLENLVAINQLEDHNRHQKAKSRVGKLGLDYSESGQGQAAKSCDRNNEITPFVK
jgi:hypothetical protein